MNVQNLRPLLDQICKEEESMKFIRLLHSKILRRRPGSEEKMASKYSASIGSHVLDYKGFVARDVLMRDALNRCSRRKAGLERQLVSAMEHEGLDQNRCLFYCNDPNPPSSTILRVLEGLRKRFGKSRGDEAAQCILRDILIQILKSP